MKFVFQFLLLFLFTQSTQAVELNPIVLQLKYAPWGTINADEDNFYYFESDDFEKYDMNFDRSLGARLIVAPFYVAVNESTTDFKADLPDATVETISAGFGGPVYDLNDHDFYVIGALGAGKGRFKFKNPDMNDWEAFIETNVEMGFRFDFLLIGAGIDYQVFGEPGETKARYWNLYLGTGIAI